MRISDICKNLEEPMLIKGRNCIREVQQFFGEVSDSKVGEALQNGYIVLETLVPYESDACLASPDRKCPYIDPMGRQVIIYPQMVNCEYRKGVIPKEEQPCLPAAHPL